MMECSICGKKFFTAYPQNWPYRYGEKVFCNEDCRIVHAARDLHKFDYSLLSDGEITKEMIERRAQKMAQEKAKEKATLTDKQRGVVAAALNGGNPLKILKEQGQKNPSAAWLFIKKKLQEKEPETYEKLMKVQPVEPLIRKLKDEGIIKPVKKAEVQKVDKLPAEAIKQAVNKVTPEPAAIEEKLKSIPGLDVLEFKVTGIETKHGKFYFDEKSGQLRWMPKDSTVVVMMQAAEWLKMIADLPEIMKVLGVQEK